ncbi:MAG: ribonuclease P protein component 2 [Candidatus Aenigmarchaeota archaeon]|nr:ribonuclease P protein component 2 [Candidatus Aenigmarchaeota archaeon]
MDRPKTLPPSMRPKKRYIVFEVISEHPVEYGDLSNSVWSSLMDLTGEAGASDARIWFISNLYDDKRQVGIIKCGNGAVESVRASLSLVQIVSESKCIVKVLGVTGTLKSAGEKYLEGHDKNGIS